ncbi:MAG: cytochrome c biogenesis protein CcdA [Phycisphaerales bacterium]
MLNRLRSPLVALLAVVASVLLAATWASANVSRSAPPNGSLGLKGLPAAPPSNATAQLNSEVRATAHLSSTQVVPNQDLVAAVVLEIEPGWHAWTVNAPPPSGATLFEDAIWTTLSVEKADGLVMHDRFTQWPTPHIISADYGSGMNKYAVYEGTAPIFVPITVSPNAALGKRTLSFTIQLQSCDNHTCLAPASATLAVDVEIVAPGTAVTTGADAVFKDFDASVFARIRAGEKPPEIVPFNLLGWEFSIDARGGGFALLLFVAAIGGFLLNLTPCVLPVIPIKIMGLSAAGGTRARTLLLGAVMSAGVVAFWIGIGIAVTSVTGFRSVNQLFQVPWFVIGVGVFIGIMAIGMAGFFSVSLPQVVHLVNPKQESVPGAFVFGIMTAILSTPCTAPLMGAAVAWATTQSRPVVLMVFGAVGLGMAVPYLVLAAFPALTSKMPRTGPASELVKQVMALLLLAAAAYFIGAGWSGLTVQPPEPPSRGFWWGVAIAASLAGLWLLIRTFQITRSPARRAVFGTIGVFITALSILIGVTQTAKGPIKWTYYTAERLAAATKRGDVVVIDFTAEWCANCKFLESTVLNLPSIARELNGAGVTPIKVDLTGNNSEGDELKSKRFGFPTIPLLVVLDRSGEVVFKSENYSPQQVLDAIQTARTRGTPANATASASGT